jgi:hypothetical protein
MKNDVFWDVMPFYTNICSSCTQPIQSNASVSVPANPAATGAVKAKCSLGG